MLIYFKYLWLILTVLLFPTYVVQKSSLVQLIFWWFHLRSHSLHRNWRYWRLPRAGPHNLIAKSVDLPLLKSPGLIVVKIKSQQQKTFSGITLLGIKVTKTFVNTDWKYLFCVLEQAVAETDNIRILKVNGHHSLLITHVNKESEGLYRVIARNVHGEAESSAELYIIQEPRPAISTHM